MICTIGSRHQTEIKKQLNIKTIFDMDEEEEKPLLLNEDDDTNGVWRTSNNTRSSIFPFRSQNSVAGNTFLPIEVPFSNIAQPTEEEPDSVVAVFVVAFDTRCGNIVEWNTPTEVDLGTVEFKAMPSGAHNIESDFIYFRLKNLFGLSIYEKLRLDSSIERGARMKSVGLLAASYTTLHRHMQFLENQVRHQLQTPGKYEQLEEFFKDRQGMLPPMSSQPESCLARKIKVDNFPQMQITHPAGCFSQFIQFFGESIFVLWKLVLLQKRILFYSQPPIGVVCYRVYCACCLGKITLDGFDHKQPKPYFYVNIADIDHLETEMSYIACTTESIFHEKNQLYDIYVNNQVVTATTHHNESILKVNKVDKERYKNLMNHRRDLDHQQCLGDDGLPSEEHFCQTYFAHLNNQLFQTLLEASMSHDRTLTEDHVRAMGLDPVGDRHFIMDLLELYAIDVMLMAENPCCPV
uniref:DENN domain-containing protein 11 n=1 Tax=Phallusia mammillata TaxID=59560 RepID=A0A6F9DGL4_9ASCI|nr:protein LCHN-like [Phallusia mammillata]